MIRNLIKKIFKKEKNTISKDVRIEIKGKLGEARQEIRLHTLDREKYKVINNILIPNKNKTSQIDHLIISSYGIFVIENKNFSGNIYGSEKDKSWTQVIGKSRNTFYNPVLQNYGHIKALQEIIGNNKPIYSIIVFGERATLKKIDIENENIKVINETKLLETIKTYNSEVLTDKEIKDSLNKVLESMSTIRQDIKTHVKNIKDTLEENKKTCPKCKSELVERTGAYGKFFGCSSYPKCRYTYKEI